MQKLTESDVLEKWSHIAMKIFPPQTDITPASEAHERAIRVRWKAATNPGPPGTRARGVDLYFPQEMVAEYLSAEAEIQLKHDAFIESAISERLRNFDPYAASDTAPPIEKWLITSPTAVA